jgi:hypothetical protein
MLEPVFDGGFMLYHSLDLGSHLTPVRQHRIEGDEYVTTSNAGELRLPLSNFHDAGHGQVLAVNYPTPAGAKFREAVRLPNFGAMTT